MTTPIDPTKGTPIQPQPSQPAESSTNLPTSYVDPTGAWAAFLSTPGHKATAHDVQLFMNGLLKFFNVIIQQQQASFKRSMDRLKKTEEGSE
jgi:hypothetical protein